MEERKEVIKKAVRMGGEKMLHAIPTEGIIHKEGRDNIATATDVSNEKAIIELIKSHFPEDTFLGEETAATIIAPLQQEHLWVIDPIDGTNNFLYGRNYCGVSVGYIEKGVMQLGAIYNPYQNELFFAERKNGAFCNDKKIHVGMQTVLGDSTVGTGNSYDPAHTREDLKILLEFPQTPWILIRGSAVLEMAEVACGRIDLYFVTTLKPWDNAAAFLLIQEAGGTVKTLQGEEATFMSSAVVAGNSTLVNLFLQNTHS